MARRGRNRGDKKKEGRKVRSELRRAPPQYFSQVGAYEWPQAFTEQGLDHFMQWDCNHTFRLTVTSAKTAAIHILVNFAFSMLL